MRKGRRPSGGRLTSNIARAGGESGDAAPGAEDGVVLGVVEAAAGAVDTSAFDARAAAGAVEAAGAGALGGVDAAAVGIKVDTLRFAAGGRTTWFRGLFAG